MGCLILCAVAGFAGILVADAIAVQESNGAKKTIPQRLAQFFREYKSEIKKVVWPGPKSVVKNTVIVLVMCLIVGAFIWLLDFGLSKLVELILQI
ncbi:MAG TPA: preprotein translocase subunit SecE [Firmicutes bacterium]|nr:preprotein translocase subunit SecE [Bacillota bacterium]